MRRTHWVGFRRVEMVSAVLAGLALILPGVAVAEEVGAIVAHMREAAGTPMLARQTGDILIRGRSTEPDSPGEYMLRFNADGQFLRKLEGPVNETHANNTTTCWKIDRSGVYRRLDLFDRDRCLFVIGIQTGQWLANLDTKNVAVSAQGNDSKTVAIDVKQGRLEAKIYIDRATWMPLKLSWPEMSGDYGWTFSGYRSDLGWKVPSKIVMTNDGKPDGQYEVQSLAPTSAQAAAYDRVESKRNDVHFDSKASPRLEVKRAVTGHVLVKPRIDGLDLGWFVFDTGAGGTTALHTGAVARLKLTQLAMNTVTTVNGTEAMPLGRAHSLQIGPLTIDSPLLQSMDLGFVQRPLGKDVMGIIGYDLLSRCVAEISLSDNSILIHEPRGYQLAEGSWQKLFFSEDLPLVPATFDGGEGLFRIDVGASAGAASNVVFHTQTVEELKLLEGRRVRGGRLGMTRIAVGKVGWFELAGHRFDNPNVIFALDRKGPLGRDVYAAGNMGVNFLKPFRVVLDYRNERVAFVPVARTRTKK
jgi:hypothetical protein